MVMEAPRASALGAVWACGGHGGASSSAEQTRGGVQRIRGKVER